MIDRLVSGSAVRQMRPRQHRRLTSSSSLFLCALLAATCAGVVHTQELRDRATGGTNMGLSLKSSAFSHQGDIPRQYTCDGSDVSPQLSWSGVPEGTKSLALIVDDPDAPDPAAPRMVWVHWLLYNLPPTAAELPEAVAASELPAGARGGLNDWKRAGYGGPCPPVGRHRYFHKLYALDVMLPDLNLPTKAEVEKAMAGHILDSAELIGTYQR